MAKRLFEKDEDPITQELSEVAVPFREETSPLKEEKYTESRKGKFVAIAGSEVIVDVNGNGERIPYIPAEHDKLKAGDVVNI